MNRFVSLALAAALVGVTGCSLYDMARLDAATSDAVDTTIDTGMDVSVPDATDADVGCVLSHPPGPPAATVDGGTTGDGGPLVFAVHDVSFQDRAPFSWVNDGWDLDNLCTTASTPMDQWSCITGDVDAGAGHVTIDGNGGRDDSFNQNFAPLFDVNVLPLANSAFNVGVLGMLVWVNGLDGDDDTAVQVGVLLAANGHAAGGGMPAWTGDGSDSFDVDTNSLVAGMYSMGPLVVDNHAYATGGLIVARLPPRSPLYLPSAMASADGGFGAIAIHLTQAILTARIVRDGVTGQIVQLNPVSIAGVWSQADATNDLNNAGICPNVGVGNIVFSNLYANLDMLTSGTPNASTPCDAISAAVYAVTYRVQASSTPVTLPLASMTCR